MLKCLIAFILGWLLCKYMGNGFSVGAGYKTPKEGCICSHKGDGPWKYNRGEVVKDGDNNLKLHPTTNNDKEFFVPLWNKAACDSSNDGWSPDSDNRDGYTCNWTKNTKDVLWSDNPPFQCGETCPWITDTCPDDCAEEVIEECTIGTKTRCWCDEKNRTCD